MESKQNLGAIVKLSPPDEDQSDWTVRQQDVAINLPPENDQGRKSIDWSFGPVRTAGYFDTSTFELGVSMTIAGINVGPIYGNLKDGVGLKLDLFIARGQVRYYLKNGNELWIRVDIKITFDGSFQGDYKIFTF